MFYIMMRENNQNLIDSLIHHTRPYKIKVMTVDFYEENRDNVNLMKFKY